MKKVTRVLCKLRHICVNVCRNDPVDVKCGGPSVLGFDFYVDAEIRFGKWKRFIEKELEALRVVPCMGIHDYGIAELPESSIWTEARIKECIATDGPGMK